jgi:hypothetical protein
MSDPLNTCGPPELCVWRYWPGICRFQTTSPQIARKLSQRRGARLVAWSVGTQYVRIFEEEIEPWCARRLVTRYLMPTNGAFFGDLAPEKVRKGAGRVAEPLGQKRHLLVNSPAKIHHPFSISARLATRSKAQARLENEHGHVRR